MSGPTHANIRLGDSNTMLKYVGLKSNSFPKGTSRGEDFPNLIRSNFR